MLVQRYIINSLLVHYTSTLEIHTDLKYTLYTISLNIDYYVTLVLIFAALSQIWDDLCLCTVQPAIHEGEFCQTGSVFELECVTMIPWCQMKLILIDGTVWCCAMYAQCC